jgi:hypothetical protein
MTRIVCPTCKSELEPRPSISLAAWTVGYGTGFTISETLKSRGFGAAVVITEVAVMAWLLSVTVTLMFLLVLAAYGSRINVLRLSRPSAPSIRP